MGETTLFRRDIALDEDTGWVNLPPPPMTTVPPLSAVNPAFAAWQDDQPAVGKEFRADLGPPSYFPGQSTVL